MKPPGRIMRGPFQCFISCFLAAAGSCCAQTAANDFFNDNVVQRLDLAVAPADWANLQANYLDNTYYHATLTWNGQAVTLGIRSHGGGSRSPLKPNLDLNFAHYTKTQTFLGLPFIIVKANNEDPSNLHEWIAMKMYRKMGFPAPREAPAQVYINGQLLGFYFMVEHEDESFLTRNFGESAGYLYEWQSAGDDYSFGNLGTDPSVYAQYLDLKTDQDTPDLQTFVNLVQAINKPADANYISSLSQYIDPSNFLTYAATENVISESDGLVGGLEGLNNFYLYQFQGQSLYQLIPWDQDFAFSTIERDIMDGITSGPFINVLAARLVGIPDYRQVYLNKLVDAATLLGGAGGWADTEINREYGVIHEAAVNDPNKQCSQSGALVPCGTQDFEAAVTFMHTFLVTRSGFVISSATAAGYRPLPQAPLIASVNALGGLAQISPGAIVNISGSNFGPDGQAASVPLPRSLGSTYVAVEGIRVPLLSTSSGQIGIQIPWDLAKGDANVVVSVNGVTSNTVDSVVGTSAPAILGIVHASGSAVTSGDPAVARETLSAFVTGLGAVSASLTAGDAAPHDVLVTTNVTPQISLGGLPATVTFSGLAPTFIGLYQVNFTVPAAPSGSNSLTLSAGDQSASATLSVF